MNLLFLLLVTMQIGSKFLMAATLFRTRKIYFKKNHVCKCYRRLTERRFRKECVLCDGKGKR